MIDLVQIQQIVIYELFNQSLWANLKIRAITALIQSFDVYVNTFFIDVSKIYRMDYVVVTKASLPLYLFALIVERKLRMRDICLLRNKLLQLKLADLLG